MELYFLSPYPRRYIANKSIVADEALTVLMHVAAFVVLSPVAAFVGHMYVAAVLFVTFLCPMWLVKVHKYKAKINGAWDEAVPSIAQKLTNGLPPLQHSSQTAGPAGFAVQLLPARSLHCQRFT